jgi:hypothetical protein
MRFALLALLLLIASVSQATILNVPTDFPTIQGGLNAASPGDTVLVAPGVYHERLTWPMVESIHLIGSGSSGTVIDADQQGAVVVMYSNYDQTVHFTDTSMIGFTIQNGAIAGNGAGILLNYASPFLEDLVMVNNHSSSLGSGGGLYAYQSSPMIYNCVFAGNSAYAGGGLFFFAYSCGTLNNVMVVDNKASESSGYAAGIYAYYGSNLQLTDCLISGNNSFGTAALVFDFQDAPTLADCTLSYNDIAVMLNRDSYPTWGQNNFIDNETAIYNNSNSGQVSVYGQYWGNTEGPYSETYNPDGVGNALIGAVDPGDFAPEFDGNAPLPAPRNVQVTTLNGNTVTLSWTCPTGVEIEGYRIGWNADSTYAAPTQWTDVDAGTQTTVTVPANMNYLRMISRNSFGVSGWYSKPVSVSSAALGDQPIPPSTLGMRVFPNPARGSATVAFSKPAGGSMRAALYDVRGRLVRELYQGTTQSRLIVDLQGLGEGIYLLRACSGGSMEVRKVLVVR